MSKRDEAGAAKQRLKRYVELGVLIVNLLVLCIGLFIFFTAGPEYTEFREQSEKTGVGLLTDPDYRAVRNRLLLPGALGIFLALFGLIGALGFGFKFFDARKPLKSLKERTLSVAAAAAGVSGVVLIFLALSRMN